MRTDRQTLVFDADDTLWENNIYFDAVVAQYVALVGSHGCPPARALERLLEIERARTKQFGYGVANFQSSLEAACRMLLDGRDAVLDCYFIGTPTVALLFRKKFIRYRNQK